MCSSSPFKGSVSKETGTGRYIIRFFCIPFTQAIPACPYFQCECWSVIVLHVFPVSQLKESTDFWNQYLGERLEPSRFIMKQSSLTGWQMLITIPQAPVISRDRGQYSGQMVDPRATTQKTQPGVSCVPERQCSERSWPETTQKHLQGSGLEPFQQ